MVLFKLLLNTFMRRTIFPRQLIFTGKKSELNSFPLSGKLAIAVVLHSERIWNRTPRTAVIWLHQPPPHLFSSLSLSLSRIHSNAFIIAHGSHRDYCWISPFCKTIFPSSYLQKSMHTSATLDGIGPSIKMTIDSDFIREDIYAAAILIHMCECACACGICERLGWFRIDSLTRIF